MDAAAYSEAILAAHRITEGTDCPLSFDTVFLAEYLPRVMAKRKPKANWSIPDWFKSRVFTLTPKHYTASEVLQALGNPDPTVGEARFCGIWMRELGCKSRKSNGRLLFYVGK